MPGSWRTAPVRVEPARLGRTGTAGARPGDGAFKRPAPGADARRMRRRVLGTTVATVALAAGLLAGQGGAQAFVQTGKVTRVVDGDTLYVDYYGDGTKTPVSTRNMGLQAMEIGTCHAAAATAVLKRWAPPGSVVRMTSVHASSRSWGRPLRLVDVKTPSGWVDPQLKVLQAGQALPLTFGNEEILRWRTYFKAAQTARAQGIGLWDPDSCKPGPQQSVPIRLWVNYDVDGDDSKNVNGEYVRILNSGDVPLKVGGWVVRTGSQDYFHLPAGTTVGARSYLTLHVGKGRANARNLYWGYPKTKFPNWEEPRSHGGGAYLFDRDGDVRASAIYPCFASCADPRAGKVAVDVHYDADGDDNAVSPNLEWVTVTATEPVDLSYTVLDIKGSTVEVGGGARIAPGSPLVVHVGKGRNTARVTYWGRSHALFANAGGAVRLRTTEGVVLGCGSWGSGRC